MNIEKFGNNEHHISLSEADVESALMQFICSCHPEYARGWIISPVSVKGAEMVCRRDNDTSA